MADEQETVDLSMLTQEERDALAYLGSDEEINAPIGTMQESPLVQQQAPAPQPDAAQQQAGQEPVQQQVVDAQAPVPEPVSPLAPAAFPKFEPPANAEALRQQYRAKEDAITEAFDSGELTPQEYRFQLRELQDQQRDLDKATMMAEISAQATKQAYDTSISSFLTQNPQYEPGSQRYLFLDTELVRLQKEAIKAGQDSRNPALLHQAHATISALYNDGQQAQGLQQQQLQPAPQPQPKLPPAPGRVIPPAFHQIPSAANTEIGDPIANALQGLNGEDFEAAFNRLPPDAREAFLARQ